MTNLDSILKSRDINFGDKGLSSQSYGFSCSHVWMCELDHKEGWTLKNRCFELWGWRILLRVPWTARRSNQSILKEISPEDAEAETPVFWPPDAKNWFIWKDPDAGKDWEQEGKRGQQRMGWLDGITDSMNMTLSKLGDSEGQGSRVCCSPWGYKELDMTELSDWKEQLNWTEKQLDPGIRLSVSVFLAYWWHTGPQWLGRLLGWEGLQVV